MQGIQKADPKWDNKDGHCLTEFPSVGKQNVLVILVNFADLKWSFCSDPHKEMQDMLQKPGYSNFDCTISSAPPSMYTDRWIFPRRQPTTAATTGATTTSILKRW